MPNGKNRSTIQEIIDLHFTDFTKITDAISGHNLGRPVAGPPELQSALADAAQKLSASELAEASAYYSSDIGIKDRELAREAVARFASSARDLAAAKIPPLTAPQHPLASELIALQGVQDTIEQLGMRVLSAEDLNAIYVTAYGSAADSELRAMIAFHKSPTGQKCLQVARAAGIKIAADSGLKS
ncbi:DUF2059 domain-containing protein [Rhizobium leguminosarum]|uniref:DUF2059 domain-containing protein n=1 Tax=Rhizobium leguminosarum TaxID=384 RepID=UPI0010307E08|nr:DUF2059 domain-containing protein [Rhizobium leguminosarum]TBF75771.1 DUF2059 domain-containing protein [Rhizobium leguminosarum]